MAESARRVVRKLTATRPVRYVLGTVLTVDEDGCEVDLGEGATVDAVVSSLVGGVAVGQDVRLSVQGNTYVVESITDGSGWITAGFAALSGWAIVTAAYQLSGGWAAIALEIERTGGDLAGSSTGALTNVNVASVPTEILPPFFPLAKMTFIWQARITSGSGYLNSTTGILVLCDLHSNSTVATGDTMTALVTYPL